jgi:colanic acid biosynthesis glycosyl transferase WcaI
LVSLKNEQIFAMTIPGNLQSYLAAGMPVVAMLNGEGAEIVERAGAGLTCSAGDAAGLAAAVLRLSSLPVAELEQMGTNALNLSRREFDRTTLLSRLEVWFATLRSQRATLR